MKKFSRIFLICYVVSSVFFIYVFGNMNFFGEQGFHMDMDTLITILTTWALVPALIISVIIYLFQLGKNFK